MNQLSILNAKPKSSSQVICNWKAVATSSMHPLHSFVYNVKFRNLLKVTIELPWGGEFDFYCTQLDHLDENWRMKQMNAIIQSTDCPHILAGGLNSLNSSDYSSDRWTDIVKVVLLHKVTFLLQMATSNIRDTKFDMPCVMIGETLLSLACHLHHLYFLVVVKNVKNTK